VNGCTLEICEGKRPWPDSRYRLEIYLDRPSQTTEIFIHDNQVPCHDSNRISLLDPVCLALWLYICIKVDKHFSVIEGSNGLNCAFVCSRNGDGHLPLVVIYRCSVLLSDTNVSFGHV